MLTNLISEADRLRKFIRVQQPAPILHGNSLVHGPINPKLHPLRELARIHPQTIRLRPGIPRPLGY
jgi:hypothetical protein